MRSICGTKFNKYKWYVNRCGFQLKAMRKQRMALLWLNQIGNILSYPNISLLAKNDEGYTSV
jgi:hypothetical protein